MQQIKDALFSPCSHQLDPVKCEICKSTAMKVIIGGSTVLGGAVFGIPVAVVSYVASYFTGFFNWEGCLFLTGLGALGGTMIGFSICCSIPGMVNINKYAVKSAVEQSNREMAGLRQQAMFRYERNMSDFQSGRTRDFPYRPNF
jgi:hypothetical protein